MLCPRHGEPFVAPPLKFSTNNNNEIIIFTSKLRSLSFFCFYFSFFFKNGNVFLFSFKFAFNSLLPHENKSTIPDNNTAIVHYDFVNPIFQDDKDCGEDCELPNELA